jgi:antitoxin (DNA-binding transcriptional repressor) of toxin-antitoxin stability system
MVEVMATVRITEAELARDLHVVLAPVREGVEVIVETDHRPVAVIKAPQGPGRKSAISPRTCKRPSITTASR